MKKKRKSRAASDEKREHVLIARLPVDVLRMNPATIPGFHTGCGTITPSRGPFKTIDFRVKWEVQFGAHRGVAGGWEWRLLESCANEAEVLRAYRLIRRRRQAQGVKLRVVKITQAQFTEEIK